MRFVSSKQDKNIYRDFSALYKEAFPKEERAPLFFLKAKAKKKVSDCFGIYDEDTFVGLLNLIYHKDIVFVFYFAVRGDLRGKGLSGFFIFFPLTIPSPPHVAASH